MKYILALLDITSKQELITQGTFLEFQEQVENLNPSEYQEYVTPNPEFIDRMTDLPFRIMLQLGCIHLQRHQKLDCHIVLNCCT